MDHFQHFRAELPAGCTLLHLDAANLTFGDLSRLMVGYIES